MEKYFKVKEHGSTVKVEVLAGITTFMAMAYILMVNAGMFSALPEVSYNAIYIATALSAVAGTFAMAFLANLPLGLASGMGLNAFFVYTACFNFGLSYANALVLVLLDGIVFIILTVTGIRTKLFTAIPDAVRKAIPAGIGLFIAYLGIKQAGFLTFTAETVSRITDNGDGSGMFADIIPALTDFTNPTAQVALIGLIITVVLLLLKVRSAILIGIVSTTVLGIFFGVTHVPELSADMFKVPSLAPTLFALDFKGIFAVDKLFITLTTVFAFSLTDTFDTI